MNRYGLVFLLCAASFVFGARYAIVVSDVTYGDPGWYAVVESLTVKHNGHVFTWQDSIGEVKNDLSLFRPDYIAFVGQPATEVNVPFVEKIWDMTRELDADPYGDAVWGVVTGYESDDALRIVQNQTLEVKTGLSGTGSSWDGWFYQAITTFEAQYNRIRFKMPDTTIVVDTVCPPRCPDDRCTLLVNYLNNGIDDTIMGYSLEGEVDYFVTSGHGNVREWQLHYPDVGLEGYFRSFVGQLYGDPYDGPNLYANSTHPRVYNAMGNCCVGNPSSAHNMPYAWLHTGGAIAVTGYMPVTTYGYMLWGLPGIFMMLQDEFTYAQAFFLNNQQLIFDRLNNTPGTDPTGLDYDRNACCYYGDPAADISMYEWRDPYWEQGLEIDSGNTWDTLNFWIEANYDSVDPGFSGTGGRRHPFAFFPERYDSAHIIDANCYDAVITDNFVLMHCWQQGDQRLAQGARREVTFVAKRVGVEEEEQSIVRGMYAFRVTPTITENCVRVCYSLPRAENATITVFDIAGRCVDMLTQGHQESGTHEIRWEPLSDITSGVYLLRFETERYTATEKIIFTD
jgi:hypothetical protein